MAHSTAKARPAFLPAGAIDGFKRRCIEAAGAAVVAGAAVLFAAVATYAPSDPSYNVATELHARNLIGIWGAHAADVLIQLFGLASILPSLLLGAWGVQMLRAKAPTMLWFRSLIFIASWFAASVWLNAIPVPDGWPLRAGMGGVSGMLIVGWLDTLIFGFFRFDSSLVLAAASAALWLATFAFALGLDRSDWQAVAGAAASTARISARTIGLLRYVVRLRRIGASVSEKSGSLLERAHNLKPHLERKPVRERLEPSLHGNGFVPANDRDVSGPDIEIDDDEPEDISEPVVERAQKTIVEKKEKKAPEGLRAQTARQGRLALGRDKPGDFQLPPLELVESPPPGHGETSTDKDSLAANAKLLESVLEEFGVKGQIVKVRPGPVVTLYELEPAPGIKTARVVSLADDIARSMSVRSVRIAVVPGRNVIGIELPNAKRDTVYFHELLGSRAFEQSGGALAIALGKDIGGAPVVVDLSKMPHLLIAGTTGSGKSVAINTMILSLLYQRTPDECKFIMIDPKMLELSVYDGIPHLLSPVVTDSKKAVVALKWAVREMEDRYRLMSQLGVRNLAGYNARLLEAKKKGEVLSRRIQTGFDEDGKPVYEDQALGTDPIPLIVVVVDEMADLMMVAGKDIEASVQRLAQMARAAGIHLIMATQRPSVDVITGTIKANFPTSVSFQVTSKIDSRTNLGEQGAEQLLGQGDMLYMAGGGQITRVHGPFVSDGEVEKIVNYLKNQGEPIYVEAVTEDVEGGFGLPGTEDAASSGDDLYDQAVALVAREGKASTSFIQRHLQIGYNRAARIIEQMEEQGVVSKADRVGRREVLVGDH
ncbi:MAG: cell division protein FtsK [Rhodospirillales bacterium]|nr:cell division protein FtsK [Rhodospirillales bacterium]